MHELFAKDDGCLGCALLCAACCFLIGSVAASPVYTVKQGDTLWGIAKAQKMSYERLCSLNNKPHDWCLIKVGQKIIVSPVLPRLSEEWLASLGTPYEAEPKDIELLSEYGDFALFAGETAADVAANQSDEETWSRNSLFLKRQKADGMVEWRLLMTSRGDWKDAEGMGEWGKMQASDIRSCCKVVKASCQKMDVMFGWFAIRHVLSGGMLSAALICARILWLY